MSKFSEYLKLLIQSRDLPISKLSRESGVERTSLHRALTGERILSYQALELLARYLELSPKESRKLYQYFNLLFEGENVRRARETFHGYGEVSRMIQMMLAEEAEYGKPELELAAPPDMQGMRAGIEKLYMAGADITISHIICFEASGQGEKYNFQNLDIWTVSCRAVSFRTRNTMSIIILMVKFK